MVFTSRYPLTDIPTVGVAELLFENRHQIPDTKPILLDAHSDRHITFGQLKHKVLQFAAGLQDKCGFQKGDVLTVFAPNMVSKRKLTTSTFLTTDSF
jgi:acyl-CoA synthetase (AMP-forming)/AMP-acid ligase II